MPQFGCLTRRFFESQLVLGASGMQNRVQHLQLAPNHPKKVSSLFCTKQPWPLLQWGEHRVESCHNLFVGHEGFLRVSWSWGHLGFKTMLNTFNCPQIIQKKQLTVLHQTTMATLAVGGARGEILSQFGCPTRRFLERELVLGTSGMQNHVQHLQMGPKSTNKAAHCLVPNNHGLSCSG